MEKIIQLDSTYVVKTLYPNPSSFVIEVNGTPPSSANDVRSTYYTSEYIYYRYLWIGNTTSKIANDALAIQYYPIDKNKIILNFSAVVPPTTIAPTVYNNYLNGVIGTDDYFVGCTFVSDKFSSLISRYDGIRRLAVLVDPISFSDAQYSSTTNSGKIVNPTRTFPNNLIVLGSSRFLTDETYLFSRGLTTKSKIQNVRTRKIYGIADFSNPLRNVILDQDMTEYDSNDLFMVRESENITKITLDPNDTPTQRFRSEGIYRYSIENPGSGYKSGDLVNITGSRENAVFTVVSITATGGILKLSVVSPGDGFTNRKNPVTGGTGSGAILHINSVSPFFKSKDPIALLNPNMLCFFPEFIVWQDILYLLVQDLVNNVVYILTDKATVGLLNDPTMYYRADTLGAVDAEFIRYQTIYPNITAPLVSYSQPVCYEVQITTISLPNLPVEGYNGTVLAAFPYVLVTLTNNTSPDNKGLVISNNPEMALATFVCPIANIRNTDVKFVVIKSSQKMMIKFNPVDSIRFEVRLPNGELLKYSTSFFFMQNNYVYPEIPPLNKIYEGGENARQVFPIYNGLFINAVFSMTML
jgi:hypothetical protein